MSTVADPFRLDDLLRKIARSFYLTLKVLPAALREPIGLAYLLARAADTIADTALLAPDIRLRHLQALRANIHGGAGSIDIGAALFSNRQGNSAERELLLHLAPAIILLEKQTDRDRQGIRRVLDTLIQGMVIDLSTFPDEHSGQIGALQNGAELENYIYHVAGCVGEFWTHITEAHTPALSHWDHARQVQQGIRFGKALQLTNILRDLPRDLRIGRCYLPLEDLTRAGLTPQDLLNPAHALHARPLLQKWINTALEYYHDAEAYTLAIPRRCLRLRLAALWPILIGLHTLARLANSHDWLNPQRPVKVNRATVYRLLALSIPAAGSNILLQRWFATLHRDIRSRIA
ncbi:MAG: hypothetical protein A2V90_08175 [Gammaproteobacteria bacterium RBG_16_57_12]|nr:MAG: hypothetical protein A2V90_08175 [Gammaproteobacteria bacterium RBG_16_57_12]